MQRDILFLALTRPALKWGVPIEALMLNVTITAVAGVELQSPVWWRSPIMFWLMGIPVHYGLRMLTGWDYHWCRTLRLELMTVTMRTLECLSTSPPRRPEEIPSSV